MIKHLITFFTDKHYIKMENEVLKKEYETLKVLFKNKLKKLDPKKVYTFSKPGATPEEIDNLKEMWNSMTKEHNLPFLIISNGEIKEDKRK